VAVAVAPQLALQLGGGRGELRDLDLLEIVEVAGGPAGRRLGNHGRGRDPDVGELLQAL